MRMQEFEFLHNSLFRQLANDPVCKPGSVRFSPWRPSIWDRHCCLPRAISRECAGPARHPVDVASDRVYRERWSPIAPVSSYLAFPPLPDVAADTQAVYLCCTCPRVAPGGR